MRKFIPRGKNPEKENNSGGEAPQGADSEIPPFDLWKAQATRQYPKTKLFLQRFARQKPDINRLLTLHEQTFAKVDCLACGNCCKTAHPIFTRTDTARIAQYLGIKTTDLEKQFLTADAEGDLVPNQLPCPFLNNDNTCQVYEVRPKSCRSYPHTDAREGWERPALLAKNTLTCPAAFHIVEEIKKEGLRRR